MCNCDVANTSKLNIPNMKDNIKYLQKDRASWK